MLCLPQFTLCLYLCHFYFFFTLCFLVSFLFLFPVYLTNFDVHFLLFHVCYVYLPFCSYLFHSKSVVCPFTFANLYITLSRMFYAILLYLPLFLFHCPIFPFSDLDHNSWWIKAQVYSWLVLFYLYKPMQTSVFSYQIQRLISKLC